MQRAISETAGYTMDKVKLQMITDPSESEDTVNEIEHEVEATGQTNKTATTWSNPNVLIKRWKQKKDLIDYLMRC